MHDPIALAASVTALAIAVADGKGSDELSVMGAVFTQLGDTLTTISIQKGLNEAQKPTTS